MSTLAHTETLASQDFTRPGVNPWLIAFTVMLATFMEVLDTSIANVALPHIAGSLSASVDESTWVLTSYLVSNAIVLPLSGMVLQAVRTQELLHGVRGDFHRRVRFCAESRPACPAGPLSRAARRRRRRAAAECRRPSWWKAFRGRSKAWPWRCTGWAWWWRRSSVRHWAAGSPTIIRGAGFSSSIFRSGCCRSLHDLRTDP